MEEFEQMHREALGLPEVPIHKLPQTEPRVGQNVDKLPQPEQEEERQAILA